MIFISDKKLNYIIGGAMKNLLSAIVVLGVFLLTGCEKVNPVSSLTEVSENSQQKNIDIIPTPIYSLFTDHFNHQAIFQPVHRYLFLKYSVMVREPE